MKFFGSLLLFGSVTCLLGQTPPPPPAHPQTPPPMPEMHLSVDNPPGPAPQVPPDRVLITVGDFKITAAQYDALVETLQPQLRSIAHGAGRKQFAENIVQMLTLAQEAQRRKITDSTEYKNRILFQDANIAASLLAEQIAGTVQVSDADLHKYFEEHKGDYEQVHAKHILIRFQGAQLAVRPGQKDLTEEEALAKAQGIRKQLAAGGDFAALAKAESDDTGTAANGGDLPPFKHGAMVPSFETAAFALKPGDLSEPVKSQFGYHLILVVSHDSKSFDDVKADIEKTIKGQQSQKVVTDAISALEKATPATLDPVYFGPGPSSVPVPTVIEAPGVKKQ